MQANIRALDAAIAAARASDAGFGSAGVATVLQTLKPQTDRNLSDEPAPRAALRVVSE